MGFGWKLNVDASQLIFDLRHMLNRTIGLFLVCAACTVAPQPKSLETVAAYEVPLPTALDKARFIDLLGKIARTQGYHVDTASPSELKAMSEVSPITLNVAVWRGDDEESMASAMDFSDRIGRVWIAFPKGENPSRSKRFRELLVPKIQEIWPRTASLPIMPNGAIPLTDDLVRISSGYKVKASAALKYQNREK